ncbi:MAG: hypothetical protein ACTTGX_05140 [Candidatus Cryptobacteroides sp.]
MEKKISKKNVKKQSKADEEKRKYNKTWEAILNHQGAFIVTEPGLFL